MSDAPHALVIVTPADFPLEPRPDETLLQAARRVGVRWPSACGGQAQCGTCVVEVVSGAKAQTEASVQESQMLSRVSLRPRHGGTLRLACQLRARGELTVFKLGVRAP